MFEKKKLQDEQNSHLFYKAFANTSAMSEHWRRIIAAIKIVYFLIDGVCIYGNLNADDTWQLPYA